VFKNLHLLQPFDLAESGARFLFFGTPQSTPPGNQVQKARVTLISLEPVGRAAAAKFFLKCSAWNSGGGSLNETQSHAAAAGGSRSRASSKEASSSLPAEARKNPTDASSLPNEAVVKVLLK
jgi:hypothetical protein